VNPSINRSALASKTQAKVTMQSHAKTVTDYLDEVPEERKAALTKLRYLW